MAEADRKPLIRTETRGHKSRISKDCWQLSQKLGGKRSDFSGNRYQVNPMKEPILAPKVKNKIVSILTYSKNF